MKEKLKLCVAALIFIFFLPYLLTVILQKGTTGDFSVQAEDAKLEQLTGILAKEIPADSEPEAIKAQAILARTNLYRCERGESDAQMPESFTPEELADYWGEDYPEYMERMRTAIAETANQVLVQDGKLVDAAYHQISSGQTRNAAETPGQEEKIWLGGVESASDRNAENYVTVIVYDAKAMAGKLRSLFPQTEDIPEEEWESELPECLEVTGRDSAGYVTGISGKNATVSGEAFRSALDLPSACFYMARLDDQIRVLVKGQGHGFGLSQYGANEMAKDGKTCEEILLYYFSNVEIRTLP